MYKEGLFNVIRILNDIRQHSWTGIQFVSMMTSIKQNFLGVYANMNEIYNLNKAIRQKEIDSNSPLLHCLYLATKHICQRTLTKLFLENPTYIQLLRI